ncbi:MAG: hypothetical protein COB30_019005 [Ectothiorhodospiraceae bacterium]|nr:hypothetical protein [Ectothiorhodospiraceae bacterium]
MLGITPMLVSVSLVMPVTALTAETAASPSLELLEFLGDWESKEGEWQDPLELMNALDALEDDAQKVNAEGSGNGQS